jgi:UDP-N-acetylmuramyl pentapeptide phosphotransferase/UDP-N-acetylglucosamine-1-phosphate transferase
MKHHIVEASTAVLKGMLFFFSPVAFLVLGVALVSVIDSIYGIKKAKKNGIKPSSKKFRYGFVPKVGGYTVVILLTYFLDFYLINEFTKSWVSIPYVSTKIISIIFIANEVVSIDENWQVIKGYSFLKKFYNLIVKVKNVRKKIEE